SRCTASVGSWPARTGDVSGSLRPPFQIKHRRANRKSGSSRALSAAQAKLQASRRQIESPWDRSCAEGFRITSPLRRKLQWCVGYVYAQALQNRRLNCNSLVLKLAGSNLCDVRPRTEGAPQ